MPTEILMPALSPTMEEGTLAKWFVKEGDDVKPGDVIAEIETDKATMEIEAADEGRIGKILVDEGTEGIAVNKPIAILLGEGEEAGAVVAPKAAPQPVAAAAFTASVASAPVSTPKPKPSPASITCNSQGRVFASPLARRIAADKGVDLTAITGSGPRGRIIRADVANATSGAARKPGVAPAAATTPLPGIDPRVYFAAGSYEEVPLDNMRKTIARRLTQSMQEIPHFYITVDCELDELLRVRKVLNEQGGASGVKLSVNDFLVRAAALALMKVPDANVSFAGNAILKHKNADIGIAVAIDGGLITPIVRNAQTKGLAEISAEARSLAERARTRKLKPGDYEGGSFSISNLGMFGVKQFTAVINPPQASILAVGRGEERSLVRNGKIEIANVMTVTLSCDHRAIDGALGAQFLQAFKAYVEYPPSMLL